MLITRYQSHIAYGVKQRQKISMNTYYTSNLAGFSPLTTLLNEPEEPKVLIVYTSPSRSGLTQVRAVYYNTGESEQGISYFTRALSLKHFSFS